MLNLYLYGVLVLAAVALALALALVATATECVATLRPVPGGRPVGARGGEGVGR